MNFQARASRPISMVDVIAPDRTRYDRAASQQDRDYDEASYVPCDRESPADQWAYDAFDRLDEQTDGIYELVGPKVQGNPHRYPKHMLERVVPPGPLSLPSVRDSDRSFAGLRQWFETFPQWEGIVFHHPDGRMAKIKRRDFGLKWPL